MQSRVVVAAIIENEGKILLGKKAKNIGPYPNTWHLPGGGVNLGEESIDDAMRREIKEETGLEVSNLERVGFDEDFEKDKHGEMTHSIFLIYKVAVGSFDVIAGDDLVELKWFDKKDLSKIPLTRPSMKLLKTGLL